MYRYTIDLNSAACSQATSFTVNMFRRTSTTYTAQHGFRQHPSQPACFATQFTSDLNSAACSHVTQFSVYMLAT